MMKVTVRAGLAAAALLAVGGCATGPTPVEVTRFHTQAALPAGTVAIVPAQGAPAADLEFQTYAAAVAPALERAGFRVVPGGTGSDLVATVAIERGTRVGPPRGPRFSFGIGGASFGRHTGIGGGTSVGVGGNRGTLIVGTQLSMQIRRAGDGTPLWEGRARTEARASTPEGQPAAAVQRLANAMLQGFPGESGRTITVR